MWDMLVHAALFRDTKMVLEILSTDSTRVLSVSKEDQGKSLMLHRVAACGYDESATLLILSGVDVNERSFMGSTPLHEAVARGHMEVARLLILNGADVHARNIMGFTPLEWANLTGNKEAIRILRLAGARE